MIVCDSDYKCIYSDPSSIKSNMHPSKNHIPFIICTKSQQEQGCSTICSVHDVTLRYIRPKQAISIVEAGHVKSSSHLVDFGTQFF